MEVIKTAIDGVLFIEPKVFGDKRGYFFESFSQREFDEKVAPILGHTINFFQEYVLLWRDERAPLSETSLHPK